ncbi:hypothetical protein [Nocardia australiensis]|uniref:hypothetical protein n=1 Tax=Nocardia australiensis TaxID=2887191 RepID=UPI001D15D3B6|nr:hypothetical protein [Nocardia australiensis]
MAPQIPGMPMPLPPTDPGAGKHNSQPWYSRADDIAFAKVALAAALAADVKGLTHASAHLRHYLSNTGKDLELDPDQIQQDDPKLKQLVDYIVTGAVRVTASDTGNYDKTIQFQLPWSWDHTFDKDDKRDWFLAIGSVHVTACGAVTVHKPDTEGAQPRVSVYFQFHLFDRYNWDGTNKNDTKKTEILGIEVGDVQLGGLHTAGVAKEFNMIGSSVIKLYEGVVSTSGFIDLPTGPESRKDTHTDPTR